MSTVNAKKAAAGPRRISSPEQMHDYMRVTSPGLWIILGTLILLLVALVVFASFFTLENTLDAQAEVGNLSSGLAIITSRLPLTSRDLVTTGQKVRIAGHEGTIDLVMQDQAELFVDIHLDDPSVSLPDGVYDAEIVLERTSPIRFLIN